MSCTCLLNNFLNLLYLPVSLPPYDWLKQTRIFTIYIPAQRLHPLWVICWKGDNYSSNEMRLNFPFLVYLPSLKITWCSYVTIRSNSPLVCGSFLYSQPVKCLRNLWQTSQDYWEEISDRIQKQKNEISKNMKIVENRFFTSVWEAKSTYFISSFDLFYKYGSDMVWRVAWLWEISWCQSPKKMGFVLGN